MSEKKPKRVVILGAGFGGMYALLNLHKEFHGKKDIHITLIDKSNHFLFTPLLHEVATGGLNPNNVIVPIRTMLNCCTNNYIKDEVINVDLENKLVKTQNTQVPYHFLISCLGSTTNFFGTPGAAENCFVLKRLSDAIGLRQRFIDIFEEATKKDSSEDRKRLLSIVVVGGGATGVELVAEIAEYFYKTFSKIHSNVSCAEDVKITLINNAPELVSQFTPVLRKKALNRLRELGVDVLLNSSVLEVTKSHVVLENGTKVESNTTIWTAGVVSNKLEFLQPVEFSHDKVKVKKTLQLDNYPNVFVLGDQSAVSTGLENKPAPMLAQVATAEGKIVAKNIKNILNNAKLVEFDFKSKGQLISIGQWMALAEIGKFHFSGKFAWWLWRTIYLSKVISWPKRIKVAADWTVNLFFPRDISSS